MEPRLIKKYGNRRLYDTEKSSYITLEDLKKYILEYTPFRVEDDKTKRDVTRECIIQIILELEGADMPIFSLEALENIVRFYGNPMQDALKGYLEQTLSFFIEQQKQMSKTFDFFKK